MKPGMTRKVETVAQRDSGVKIPEQPVVEMIYDRQGMGIAPKFNGQTLVLVGNGPSAKEHADWIDRAGPVVRVQGFPVGEAGHRWDVWAGSFGTAAIDNVREFKMTQHRLPDVVWALGTNTRKFELEGLNVGRFLVPFPPEARGRLEKHCPNPTSGFLALEAALRSEPDELIVVGFDATAVDEPGWKHWDTEEGFWGWWPEKANPALAHHLGREKQLMEHWLKTREFCGMRFPKTKPRWWRMKSRGQGGDLAGKRVCIVGNGPSAVEHAERIDREFDVVIRINAFPVGEAGSKWDAWFCTFSGIGGDYVRENRMDKHPTRPSWIWMPGTLGPELIPFEADRVDLMPPTRIQQLWRLFNKWTKVPKGRHPQTGKVRPIQCTSGMIVLDMALDMEPSELTLVGFDAVSQDEPGWKHYGKKPCAWHPERPSKSGGKHDYRLEKELVQKWVEERIFFDRLYPHTKPQWWRLKG
jgi:hypothetical protein